MGPRGDNVRSAVLQSMRALLACGVSVVPIRPNGTKAALVAWQPYQQRLATDAEVDGWAERFAHVDAGLAIVTGVASGNVEVLDFDDATLVKPWHELVEQCQPGLVDRLVVVQTPRPGMSVWYRCETIEGNQKLAEGYGPTGEKKTLIETRGQGGYALIPPSPAACHETLRPYRLRQGTLQNIPTIYRHERELLLNCARCFHSLKPESPKRFRVTGLSEPASNRPGDLFAAAVHWPEVLEPHGWVLDGAQGELSRWRRPGKDRGHSATSGLTPKDLLYVFSSNASPFEAGHLYDKFRAFALLNYHGDCALAARAVLGLKPRALSRQRILVGIGQ